MKSEHFIERRKARATERRAAAAALRRLGCSYQEIGEKLGITRQAAFKLVKTAIRRLQEEAAEDLEAMRVLELERMDRWLVMVAQEIRAGNVLPGIDRGLRIMERRAKLLGLDAKESIEVRVSTEVDADFSAQLSGMSDEELLRVVDGTWKPGRKRKASDSVH